LGVRGDVRTIDAGVRDAVMLLGRIPGVTTRASCEGAGRVQLRHRHSDLAYVLFRHPLPVALEDFLLAHLGSVARIECAAIYSRWPAQNHVFLERLEATVHSYLGQGGRNRQTRISWPLSKLRARLARQVSRRQEVRLGLCFVCADLVSEPHPESHRQVGLLRLPADQQTSWFADFARRPESALGADLIARDGWLHLAERTQRGDFGALYQRRWLRYRARMVAGLTTEHLRRGVENARRTGSDIDFFYDTTHAVFAWR
jgi:hypothetical protein